jgi:2-hydroxychromene-2-carboxylate isomerase
MIRRSRTLTRVTEKVARDLGAYGCPWFWVYDGKGNAEPFFGSDRFHYMWDYLDIPHEDLALHVQAKL